MHTPRGALHHGCLHVEPHWPVTNPSTSSNALYKVAIFTKAAMIFHRATKSCNQVGIFMNKKIKINLHKSIAVAAALIGLAAQAASPDDARGRWMTAEKDGVIEFKGCDDNPAALCGHLVWDKDAGTAKDNCGMLITQLGRYVNDAWREGWVLDPRDNKKYKGVLRVKDGKIHLRAFVGSEILGQTELMTRVEQLPASPVCAKR
jgi:uncharacterized protein (DUF2147 family)